MPSVPVVRVGKVDLQCLEVGGNPFHGISYIDPRTADALRRRFSEPCRLEEVIGEALRQGVATVSISPRCYDAEFNSIFFDAIRSAAEAGGCVEMSVVPWMNIEHALEFPAGLDREAVFAALCSASAGLSGLDADQFSARFLGDPLLDGISRYERLLPDLGRSGLERVWARMRSSSGSSGGGGLDETVVRFRGEVVRRELDELPFDMFRVPMARPGGHVTDALVALGRLDILGEYADVIRERVPSVMFSTHFSGVSVPLLDDSGAGCDGYVVPVNRLGALMWPTKGEVEATVTRARRPIFAIKPLAGGYAVGRESFDYVFGDVGVDGALVGVSSVEEAHSSLGEARRVLLGLRNSG
jgi:hypothetical protein